MSLLVLSRKQGETIRIGDTITIEVRQIRDNRVHIGVRAPREVRVLRGELFEEEEQAEGGAA